jgi:NitT/TauT family transport system substrate-binding protein
MVGTLARRRFLNAASLAAAANLVCSRRLLAAEEETLETTSVRLFRGTPICGAPVYVAEELLRAEGFTDIRYVEPVNGLTSNDLVRLGGIDFISGFAIQHIKALDAGVPFTVLVGLHAGCFEFFAQKNIHGIAELRGKSVGLRLSPEDLLTLMAAQVGLDPIKDIHWVTGPSIDPLALFAQGKIDAFLGFPPEPQELRAQHAGHVIVSTAADRPWSQYFCCMLSGRRDYVRNYPVATKRAVRAILKATDLCATDPVRAAGQITDRGFTPRYDYALQTLNENLYDKWREYDAEDTLRFYALRLHEARLIKSTPQKIIAEGTDWRFLNELKRELKA